MLKKLLCTLTALVMLVTPVLAIKGEVVNPDELPYIPTEGSPSSWAASEIKKAADAGLIPQFTGDPSYQDEITREQFAQLAVRLVEVIQQEELPAAAEGTFSDSDSLAVRKASQAGIVTGTGGDKFAPTLTTNREQIATMLFRAVGVVKTATGVDLAPKAGSVDGYTDQASVSPWAAEGVGALAANGIMKGNGSALSPQEPCSVEQAILLAWRLYAQYGDQAG